MVKGTKYLVLDSRIIDETTGAKLTVGKVKKDKGNPFFKGDKPWEPNISNGFPTVLWDEEDRLYKCWYNAWIIDKAVATTPPEKRGDKSGYGSYLPDAVDSQPFPSRDSGVCYAISKDGIHWEKPELGVVEFNGDKKNNLVFSAEAIPKMANASPDLPPSKARGPHCAGIFKDYREGDPAKLYKMVFRDYSPSDPENFYISVAFSPDGLRWDSVPCPETDPEADALNNAFWDPELEKYVLITRRWSPDRVVARCESPDFLKWTKPEVVLSNSQLGLKHQIYSMPVFRYAGLYIGLAAIFNQDNDRVHTELAWSPDTVKWHRINPGTPLIANGDEKDDYDWGCIYTAHAVFTKDEIRIYYMGDANTHYSWRDSGLCLATLRPDGFVGYEPYSDDVPALIKTKPVICSAKSLGLSVDVRGGGSVQVKLLDEGGKSLAASESMTSQPEKWEWEYETNSEITDGRVTWTDGWDFSVMAGKKIQLEFELDNATLYSFSFSD